MGDAAQILNLAEDTAEPVLTGPITIEWNNLSPADWAERLAKCPRSNLLQSFAYARAVRAHRHLMPRFGVIRQGGIESGIVQIAEAKVLGVHTLVLDRGPLWFDGRDDPARNRAFLIEFTKAAPWRLGRFRHVMPEFPDTPENRAALGEARLKPANKKMIGQRSIWIDLAPPEAVRRAALAKGWRGHLKQAEKENLIVAVDESGRTLPWAIGKYSDDKRERGYPGPKPAFLATIAEGCFAQGQGFLLRASKGAEALAFVLILGHGRSATYQTGWTSDRGRAANAHHLLLWRACQHLAAKGYRELDLGGVNPEQAEGVTQFKEAMGGTPYQLVPVYR